jgi:uncharacterized protein with HEPN domain
MAQPDDDLRLGHMLQYARKALRVSHGRSRIDLESDEGLVLALTKALEVIGEAANRVSRGRRAKLPAVPWSKIIGMRNRLIHGYDQLDLDILWRTVERELPALVAALEDAARTKPPR